jgi:hypothetical protein
MAIIKYLHANTASFYSFYVYACFKGLLFCLTGDPVTLYEPLALLVFWIFIAAFLGTPLFEVK